MLENKFILTGILILIGLGVVLFVGLILYIMAHAYHGGY